MQTHTVDVLHLEYDEGQSCSWEISVELLKADYYDLELYIDFKVITNIEVIILSGYNKETAHTIDVEIEQGFEVDFPIFNKTWIIAVPKEG